MKIKLINTINNSSPSIEELVKRYNPKTGVLDLGHIDYRSIIGVDTNGSEIYELDVLEDNNTKQIFIANGSYVSRFKDSKLINR